MMIVLVCEMKVKEEERSQNLLFGPNLVEITTSFKLCEFDSLC